MDGECNMGLIANGGYGRWMEEDGNKCRSLELDEGMNEAAGFFWKGNGLRIR